VSEPRQRTKRWKLGLLLLVGVAALGGIYWATLLHPEVVDRAPDGRAILIRSPQLTAKELAQLHAQEPIKTVLNLRGDQTGKEWFEAERAAVKAMGARWMHLRLSGKRTPLPGQVDAILDLLEDPTAWPIVAHCWGGVHRTGLVVALYRIQYEGWTSERAIADMEAHWFNWTTSDRSALKKFLRGYVPDPKRKLPN
jgi:tyrosine-protein phosphatase SIW14